MESTEECLKSGSSKSSAGTVQNITPDEDEVSAIISEKSKPVEDDSRSDAVKDTISEGENVKDTISEGENVKDAASEGENMEDAISEGENVKDVTSEGETMKDVTSEGETMKDVTSEGETMKDVTSEGENVKDATSKVANMEDETSEGENVKDATFEGGEAKETISDRGESRTSADQESKTEGKEKCSEKSAEILTKESVEGTAENSSDVSINELASEDKTTSIDTEIHTSPNVSPADNTDQSAKPDVSGEKTETESIQKSSSIESPRDQFRSKDLRTKHAETPQEDEKDASSLSKNQCSGETDSKPDETPGSSKSNIIETKADKTSITDAAPCNKSSTAKEQSVDKCRNEEGTDSENTEEAGNTAVEKSDEKKSADKIDATPEAEGSNKEINSGKNDVNKESTMGDSKETASSKKTECEGKSEEVQKKKKSQPSTSEEMEVDDSTTEIKIPAPITEEHPAEHDDAIQAMARADVDNECTDDPMDGATHHEEDDPLSSTASGKDNEGDSHMDVDEPTDKTEHTIMEIHEDLLKDGDVKDEIQADEEPLEEDKQEDETPQAVASSAKTPDDKLTKEDENENKDAQPKDHVSKTSKGKGADDKAVNEGVPQTKEGDNATGKVQEPVGREADDDICIVPDTVPQMMRKKLKEITRKDGSCSTQEPCTDKKSEIGSEEGLDEKEETVVGTRATRKEKRRSRDVGPIDVQTPRPQRQAARKAESQIKQVLAADENYEQPIEEQPVEEQPLEEPPVNEPPVNEPAPPPPALMYVDKPKDVNPCQQCGLVTVCKYQIQKKGTTINFCTQICYKEYQSPDVSTPVATDAGDASETRASLVSTGPQMGMEVDRPFVRTCGQCTAKINVADERVLTWETMDFCHEECLGKYQTALGSHCANCKGAVQNSSLGKYCVRFGYDIKQFCCAGCLEEFKKGLKVCSYCQKDISGDQEGFLAPVGDKGQFKDFCTSACMEKYEAMSSPVTPPPPKHQCAVCNQMAVVRVEVLQGGRVHQLCSAPCFAAFKFGNTIVSADQCDMCKKYFDKAKSDNFTIFYGDAPHSFCCKTCMNVYILAKRKIVPCTWCKVKKYNFDMIKKGAGSGQVVMMCSLNCLTLYQVSVNAVSVRRVKCDSCGCMVLAQYHLTMSDATLRNFCSYNCVGNFQSQFSRAAMAAGGKADAPVPTGGPKRAISRRQVASTEADTVAKGGAMPVISSVTSLAPNGEPAPTVAPAASGTMKVRARPRRMLIHQSDSSQQAESELSSKADYSKQPAVDSAKAPKAHIIVRPPHPPQRQNCGVQVRPFMHNKGVSCRPQPCTKETQTDDELNKPAIIPIPVPIYIPAPMCMYSTPFPVPVPFPLPIPVPIFIPTTKNSTKGIMKDIKRIQEKIPTDPFEAELLMMAEMVAAEKKSEPSDSESEDNEPAPEEASESGAGNGEKESFSPDPEAADTSNTFGEDIMQMALKFASTLDEPAVDFEAAVASTTIVPGSQSTGAQSEDEDTDPDDPEPVERQTRSGRKRSACPLTPTRAHSETPTKRDRRVSSSESLPILPPTDGSSSSGRTDVEKPDANLNLKYTYGVNAWRQWVLQKNAQLEKGATNNRKLKLFKTDLLQLTSDELNYSLCLFVKEVRKPNGSEYAPDTIYYLCLGIQLYLIVNGRVDNIFSDPYYEKFTECLDEVAKKFSALYDDTRFIVTRVEEEHLWESKQLGAHSPHVLLSTLMFFNTKHFNITNVDEHMLLSFSHIMKHWKRNSSAQTTGKPGRNVLLRFYPSQASFVTSLRKKKVYEQSENEGNPLRCPVKLYEFYLSKCPESVKTRNDVFYLQPERSCVPDSPVWYSTSSLGKETLFKMLRRVKMVKEINEAILK